MRDGRVYPVVSMLTDAYLSRCGIPRRASGCSDRQPRARLAALLLRSRTLVCDLRPLGAHRHHVIIPFPAPKQHVVASVIERPVTSLCRHGEHDGASPTVGLVCNNCLSSRRQGHDKGYRKGGGKGYGRGGDPHFPSPE